MVHENISYPLQQELQSRNLKQGKRDKIHDEREEHVTVSRVSVFIASYSFASFLTACFNFSTT